MTRYRKAEFRPARERIAALPEDRRHKIEDGGRKIVVDLPDGTFAEIPVEHGRPVKSRLSVGHTTTGE